MPSAIKNGGLIFGGVGTIIIGILCAHCVHILVRSSQVLCRKAKLPQMTYAETAAAAFQFGPKPLRKYADHAKSMVDWTLCATHIGGICVYVVLIATGLKQVSDYLFIYLFFYSRIQDNNIFFKCIAGGLLP